MDTHNLYPVQQDTPTEASTKWYRNISPNSKIDTVPVAEHADAITTAVLDMLGKDIPDNTAERMTSMLSLTTYRGLELMSASLALEADRALPVTDMILEFTERTDTNIPNNVKFRLLSMTKSILSGIREGSHNEPGTRLAANAKLSNANVALLDLERSCNPEMTEAMYSDSYIKLVRQEAKWFSEHTVGARTGDLFENYVTCLMRQMVWDQEIDTTHSVRHATIWEDQPNPKKEGGTGHGYAHDIHTITPNGVGMIQCKYGPGAHEARSYKPSVTPVIETGEEDLTNNADFKEAFFAIARGTSQEDVEHTTRMIKKYNLEEALQPRLLARAATVTTALATY